MGRYKYSVYYKYEDGEGNVADLPCGEGRRRNSIPLQPAECSVHERWRIASLVLIGGKLGRRDGLVVHRVSGIAGRERTMDVVCF